MTITVVHCWSAPRSRSTALLYSFESRNDCVAIDEPLYRRWLLDKGDKAERPYKQLFLSSDDEWKKEEASLSQRIHTAVRSLQHNGSSDDGVVFLKHMAKHAYLYNFDEEEEKRFRDGSETVAPIDDNVKHVHVLLIRDPVAVLSSWKSSSDIHGNAATADEVGIVPLLSVYSSLSSRRSIPPSSSSEIAVLDSDQLASDPEATFQSLCRDLSIPYLESMLSWKSGPHECDGPWAPWWYQEVHKSTGWFDDSHPKNKVYPTLQRDLILALRTSLPAYQYLKSIATGTLTKEGVYEDERNGDLLVWVGSPEKGRLVPREMAALSPWDSSVQGGDAVWEGLRIYRGTILSFERHLKRLFKSAKALKFENMHTPEQIREAVFRTLAANGMRDGAHIRLTLTRGEKYTSSMNPKFNIYGTTLIVLPEWKPTEGATTYDNTNGISLITASTRRNPPSCIDSKIHHNNMINNILPKLQANQAGAADAIMLDLEGFVSETNATNLFMVNEYGTLVTPCSDYCLPGITRETVLILAKELGIECEVRRVSLAEFHAAEEVFTTGTMGELTPVTVIDGRVIGEGVRGSVTGRLQEVYKSLPERPGWAVEIPPFR